MTANTSFSWTFVNWLDFFHLKSTQNNDSHCSEYFTNLGFNLSWQRVDAIVLYIGDDFTKSRECSYPYLNTITNLRDICTILLLVWSHANGHHEPQKNCCPLFLEKLYLIYDIKKDVNVILQIWWIPRIAFPWYWLFTKRKPYYGVQKWRISFLKYPTVSIYENCQVPTVIYI